jgi:hypothetical protein
VSEWREVKTLKGRPIIAQGKAQQRPGFASPKISQALKGRHNWGVRMATHVDRFCFALSGLDLFWAGEPRALPWAIILRPFGAELPGRPTTPAQTASLRQGFGRQARPSAKGGLA